jgi:hypothetical protein
LLPGHRARGEDDGEGNGERKRVSEGQPGLHSERARDVETPAMHACQVVARLCARSATTFTERY